VAEHPARNAGWRGYFGARVWPWVVMAWLIPASLSFLLVRILDQSWLRWLLTPSWALAPVLTWWMRGRGREPFTGFLAIFWLLITVQVVIERTGITVSDQITELWTVLLFFVYWPTWAWFYKLRKLPSSRIGAADKLSISIFLIAGSPSFAAALGGPDAAKDLISLAIGLVVALFWTVGLVVAGLKGPTLMKEMEKLVVDIGSRAALWVRLYTDSGVLIAASFGFITVFVTFKPILPNWLAPGLGVMYVLVVILLQALLIRPSEREDALSSVTRDHAGDTSSQA
jgi:hypothetical protein